MPEIFGTSLTPFWSSPTGEVRSYHGNLLAVLRAMPARVPRITAALVECGRRDLPAVVDEPPEPIRLFGGNNA